MNANNCQCFTVQCDNQPAALERILRVLRVRGFVLHTLSVSVKNQLCVAEMTVCGKRSMTLLIAQLNKLELVREIHGPKTENFTLSPVCYAN